MSYNLNATNADCCEGTTTLINKLGIKEENELKSSEALITAYKAASLINESLAHNFGFENYSAHFTTISLLRNTRSMLKFSEIRMHI